MSDTDDTDDLLLIPPDFFTQNFDTFEPYYNVVDCLISQVNQLENRINLIESVSDLTALSDFEMQSPNRNKPLSTQSTPQKPRTKFTMNSLPNSPDLDQLKKGKATKSDYNPKLGEIDSFLSNVKQIKRLNAVRNLETDYLEETNTQKLDLNRVNEMLKDLEMHEKRIEEKSAHKERAWQCGDSIHSVPDYGFGMRKNMYDFKSGNTDTLVEKSDDASDCTQTYEAHCKRNENLDLNLGLVSLGKLWDATESCELPTKLQEERLRRQHCEQAILELQNRVLELQQRVAVAVQVDEAKDKAILRFHESWEKSGVKLKGIERQKEYLEQEIDKLRRQLEMHSDETHQKICQYEKETTLALDMARNSRDKLTSLEKRYEELQQEFRSAEMNSEEFQRKFLEESERNKHFAEILAHKELELKECKSVLAEARTEVSQSKMAIEICQSELQAMKNENAVLQSALDSEKSNNKKINEQKNKLLEEVDKQRDITRELQGQLKKSQEQLENSKIELKSFYQGQVELVVQNKLKEFQKQLDEAETAMKNQFSKKEMSIAKTAASHIQQISEKHNLEIKLLEEKHQEESRLYQVQISQLKHELAECSSKMKRQHEKHMHIEKQLNKFMESLRQDHMTTLDEINSFRSKSFNNLEEILSFNMAEDDKCKKNDSEESIFKETPVTSKDKGSKRKEQTLQETIQMLLDRKEDDVTKETYHRTRGKPAPWK